MTGLLPFYLIDNSSRYSYLWLLSNFYHKIIHLYGLYKLCIRVLRL
nr:MAG TPA: hypothetical protein [Caudoviricetes sp.]DAI13997.1 MAG TPA: hypothetical protein [Caudoviricetes sp.]DAI46295.1 MAG TPA: hypothetical protein [Caudoviricetes sp.]